MHGLVRIMNHLRDVGDINALDILMKLPVAGAGIPGTTHKFCECFVNCIDSGACDWERTEKMISQ